MNLIGSATLHRKLVSTFLVLVGCVLVWSATADSVSARPHIVVDAETGKVLAHNRAHRRWAPASLTKLMTTYVTFRAIKLQQINFKSPVTISARASRLPPSKMGFAPGTVLTIDQAIKIIMVKSANDVALALGESVAGNEAAFVALMNAHARRLGMENTQFRNPHGLPNKAQYTTAVDMAKLGIAIQKEFPEYQKYLKVPGIIHGRRRMRNFNRLLTRFSGTTGMKTGYICASGYNVIVSAERKLADGKKRKLVAVVMGQTSGRRRNAKAAEILYKSFRKGRKFGEIVLAEFEPKTKINPTPADITDETCRRKKRSRKKNSAASIKNLEARYMSKPFDIGSYHKIVLGGATGPNPHASRFKRSDTKTAVIPFPTKRPPLICPVFTDGRQMSDGLDKLVSLEHQKQQEEKVENLMVEPDESKSGQTTYPTPTGCLPVPMAKKELPEPVVLMAKAETDSQKTISESDSRAEESDTGPKVTINQGVTAVENVVRVAKAFEIFDISSLPIPTPRDRPTLLTSFAANDESELPSAETRSLTITKPNESVPEDNVVNSEAKTDPSSQSTDNKFKAEPEETTDASVSAATNVAKTSELPEKPVKETDVAMVSDPQDGKTLVQPEHEIALAPDAQVDASEDEIEVAALPPDYGIFPVKRPDYKIKENRKQDKPKKVSEEKTPVKKEDKKTKKPAKNPFANNVCRMYRNSGCFPELLKAKKSGKKSKATAKKLPAHCPALQSLYRQNRKGGLDCKAG